jgi:lipopolysaccharide/colanic/teichoic acid biosynthesis glycosyltransferase
MTAPQVIKRLADVTIAVSVLVLASPALLLIALLILILEGRPVWYVSRRHITPDRAIPVFKFRTMVRDASSPKYRLKDRFMRGGFLDIPRNCEVYTPIGRILERLQIVELPQLLNIVLHGMTLIGNRPLPAENLRLLSVNRDWSGRFDSPAGISGIAQVVGKLNIGAEERLALEASYSKVYKGGKLLYCDLMIVYWTMQVILLGTNITLQDAQSLLSACEPKAAARRGRAAAA